MRDWSVISFVPPYVVLACCWTAVWEGGGVVGVRATTLNRFDWTNPSPFVLNIRLYSPSGCTPAVNLVLIWIFYRYCLCDSLEALMALSCQACHDAG